METPATPTPDQNQPAPPATSSASWADAAKPPATPDAAPAMPSGPGMGAGQQPQISMLAVPPIVITPAKRGGILGVVDSVADALTGKTAPEIGHDQQGNAYVKERTLSRGEQWTRIAGELASGAAKGFAAGRGNNPGAAAAAGVDEGEHIADANKQNRQDLTAQARQENLDNANHQMQVMQQAEQAFRMTRLQVEANQHDIDFAQAQEDRLTKDGGVILGVMKNAGDISSILKVNPDVMKDMVQKHLIKTPPHYDEQGHPDGFTVIQMPYDYGKTMLPAGSVFHTFDPIKGQYVEHRASDPMTAQQRDVYDMNASTAAMKFKSDQVEQNLKTQQAQEAAANTAKVPSEINKNNAEARKANADAEKARTPSVDDPQIMQLGEAAARGGITEDQVPGFSKLKPAIQAYLALHHPNLDQTSVFLTGEERKRRDLANNAIHNLDDISTRLQRRPDLLGKIAGLVTEGKETVGTDDRDLADIMTALDNYALASTGAHGIRAVQARADAKKAFLNGFKNGPNGVAASAAAAKASLTNLASAGKPRGIDGSPYLYKQQQPGAPAAAASPAPATHVFDPKAWKAANPNGDVNAAITAAKAQGYEVKQ